MSTSQSDYNTVRDEFLKVCKRILKENLTTNRIKHVEYLHDLIETFNDSVNHLATRYPRYSEDNRLAAINECKYLRGKIVNCFRKLNIQESLPVNSYFANLELAIILKYFTTAEIQSVHTEQFTLAPVTPKITPATSTNSLINSPNEANNLNMAQLTAPEFLRLAENQINQKYFGDPLSLNSFIDSVNLLKQLVGPHGELLIQFVVSKLDGKARECIPQVYNSIDDIINALKNSIKPESSKVIEGRMLALKFDISKTTDYAKEAEGLAEAFQRSLIVEGIPQNKAKSMAIERTVEMCRQSSRYDTVESVLASSAFSQPNEVVAKFLIETNTQQKRQKEKQVFAFQKYNNWGNKRRFNSNRQNNYSQSNNFNLNRGNRRGRGGNRYNSRRGNRQNYSRGYGQNNTNQNPRYVNYAENAPGPSQTSWRPETQTSQPHIPFSQ